MMRVFTTVVIFVTLTIGGCATTPNPQEYINPSHTLDYETFSDQDKVKLDHKNVVLEN